MFVIKRDGRQEGVHLNKITARIAKLCHGLNMNFIDPAGVAVKVVKGMYAGVTTRELDQLAAETCKSFLLSPFAHHILPTNLLFYVIRRLFIDLSP